ncbi:MAG: hypothetical protein K0Q62_2280 [Phenylobacterium sp.]|jgi:hypothetical protein|nr:hypothetical protein [Phenylobacterium sp.]HVK42595.1 hypothetical protein [Phenylobacterium sp.]
MLSQPDDLLFTFGHSFGERASHISEQIAAGAIGTIYYGIFSVADAAPAIGSGVVTAQLSPHLRVPDGLADEGRKAGFYHDGRR